MPNTQLDAGELAFLVAARRAILVTIDPHGRPRPVPVCFIVDAADPTGVRVVTPLDDKPKATRDKRTLARVRDIRTRPEVSLLVDRWDEDWSRLAWLQARGKARPTPQGPEAQKVIGALRGKYAQYGDTPLEGPVLRIDVDRWLTWEAS